MPRKSTTKTATNSLKVGSCKYVSLSDVKDSLILRVHEEEREDICHRGNSKSDQDWRKILKQFYDFLDSKQVEQLRFYGISNNRFSLHKTRQDKFAVKSILFDKSTDPDVLYGLIPLCSTLQHVTMRGCSEFPYEKRHYVVRMHNSEINPFETIEFVYIRGSIFSKDPMYPNDPKFLPKKILSRPLRYNTEIFVRYHLTLKGLSDLTGYLASQGGCFYQKDWMVYKMRGCCQLFCKVGLNGIYCVVVPSGVNTIVQTPLQQFTWNDDDHNLNELLSTPQEVKERMETPMDWNNLPDNIKLLCIDRMHFKTRLNLRSTCHTERKLVDCSTRYEFKFVKVEHLTYTDDSQTMSVIAQNPRETLNIRSERWVENGKCDAKSSFNLILSSIKSILQFCKIDGLFLYPGAKEEGMKQLLNVITDSAPFKFSTFFSNVMNPDIQFFMVKNCDITPDLVFLRVTKHFTPKVYFDNPKVISSKCLQLQLDKPGDLTGALQILVTKWIAADAQIGKKAVFGIEDRFCAFQTQPLAKKFSKRVISETDEMILFRTNDNTKQVLVSVYNDHDDSTYVTCRVISSQLKEKDYELYDRPWICESEVTYNFQEYDEEDESDEDYSSK